MSYGKQLAYIGRPFTCSWDSKAQKVVKITLNQFEPLYIDYSKKKHCYVVAQSGGGKSYLAGVIAEELIRIMENYAVILIDPMGIFSTLKNPNNNLSEINEWNALLGKEEISPAGIRGIIVWVPAGDTDKFLPNTYDRRFSMRASEFSYSTLCYAFSMDFLDPQVNLYRKAQAHLRKSRGNYSLGDLIVYIHMSGKEMGFQQNTIESLLTKLGALEELGIIAEDAPAINEVIKSEQVSVFDLSQSSTYTARILVNFLSERVLGLRSQITRMVTQARVLETQIEKPSWYIPPTQFLIDEAHNFLRDNAILKKIIKEGRNHGVLMTAISQSPDLTRDIYANMKHLFVGPLIYADDIAIVKSMLPIEISLKDFTKQVHSLKVGQFLYYNIDDKIEKTICVRPRRTMHPASTELIDERRWFKEPGNDLRLEGLSRSNPSFEVTEAGPIKLPEGTKVPNGSFSLLLPPERNGFKEEQKRVIICGNMRKGEATIVAVLERYYRDLPSEVLSNSINCVGRPLNKDDKLTVLRMKW